MNHIVVAYSIYLPVAVMLTVWVARTLYLNSKVFLVDIFHGQTDLAAAVNKLLQVGFYLISLGFAVISLEISPRSRYNDAMSMYVTQSINDAQSMMEALSYKLGAFTLILGMMLFLNLFILLMLRGGAIRYKQAQLKVQRNISTEGI